MPISPPSVAVCLLGTTAWFGPAQAGKDEERREPSSRRSFAPMSSTETSSNSLCPADTPGVPTQPATGQAFHGHSSKMVPACIPADIKPGAGAELNAQAQSLRGIVIAPRRRELSPAHRQPHTSATHAPETSRHHTPDRFSGRFSGGPRHLPLRSPKAHGTISSRIPDTR